MQGHDVDIGKSGGFIKIILGDDKRDEEIIYRPHPYARAFFSHVFSESIR
jgi:hypothetical protein